MGVIVTTPLAGFLCASDFLGGWPAAFYVFGRIDIHAQCSRQWRFCRGYHVCLVRFLVFLRFQLSASTSAVFGERTQLSDCVSTEAEEGLCTAMPTCRTLTRAFPVENPMGRYRQIDSLLVHRRGIDLHSVRVLRPADISAHLLRDDLEIQFAKSTYSLHDEESQDGPIGLNCVQNGVMFAIPYIFMMIVIVLSGQLADRLRARKTMSTTAVRKLQTVIGESHFSANRWHVSNVCRWYRFITIFGAHRLCGMQ